LENGISVHQLLSERDQDFHLGILAGEEGLARKIVTCDVNRPGLALAGYTGYFVHHRVQIVGGAEITYLSALPAPERSAAIDRVFSFDLPCVIVTRGQSPPAEMVDAANTREIPLLQTSMSTTPFVHQLTAYLDFVLAPQIVVHGTLVDVFGVGLLYTGDAGIGKSECALALVERGHRLVADDVVTIKRRGRGILIGYANDILRQHIEIRGVGIVDLAALYGIRAVRMRKRVEVEVQLKRWTDTEEYERLGLEEQTTSILDVGIPAVTMPLVPGKNIAIISEVVAMNYLLKLAGYHPAQEFNQRLRQIMENQTQESRYHEEDLE
jgi:HPr kinase/phosphorylase